MNFPITEFSKREVKLMRESFTDGFIKSENQEIINIFNYIKHSKTIKLFDVKLCIKEINANNVIVEYAYLEEKKRGHGNYKRVINKLLEKYDYVLHEPSIKWFTDHIEDIEFEKIIKHNGEKKYFFEWGSNKNNELLNYKIDFEDHESPESMLTKIITNRINGKNGVIENYNMARMFDMLRKRDTNTKIE